MKVVFLSLAIALAPSLASAQAAEPGASDASAPADRLTAPRVPPTPAPQPVREPRSRQARYDDALAGTWAAIGLGVVLAGGLGALIGSFVGCSTGGDFGCTLGLPAGAAIGAMAGWLVGAGLGASAGAGLEPVEGFGVWALGFAAFTAFYGLSFGVGALVDLADGPTSAALTYASVIGVGGGLLLQAFLTPLFAVHIYEDRDDGVGLPIVPTASPLPGGGQLGFGGAF